jgi:arginyl-tRNA synthetase
MAVTDALAELVSSALSRAVEDGVVPAEGMPSPSFERPRQHEHGDWATNIALAAAKGRGKPRDIAQALVERLPGSDIVDRVEVAGPGFLNFYLSSTWLHDVVRRAADPASRFGRSDEGGGGKVNVEYVSSNPTGPVNVVSGRHAAVGDAIANLLEAIGHDTTREFYANDSGRQIELFARSISVRYLQQLGVEAELPEDGYQGEYMSDIARTIRDEVGDSLVDSSDRERDEYMGARGLELMLEATRRSLERFGTRHDIWFRESTLHEKDEIKAALARLSEQGWIEDREGASWFLSSKLGDDKDRVVVRADGKTTYLAADIAYLLDKFGRGFDRLIYLWGPDHHGAVPRLTAAVEALGFERDRVEIEIVQIVNLLREGVAVRALHVSQTVRRRSARFRHRAREAASTRESRLLRAVRARSHLLDHAQGAAGGIDRGHRGQAGSAGSSERGPPHAEARVLRGNRPRGRPSSVSTADHALRRGARVNLQRVLPRLPGDLRRCRPDEGSARALSRDEVGHRRRPRPSGCVRAGEDVTCTSSR